MSNDVGEGRRLTNEVHREGMQKLAACHPYLLILRVQTNLQDSRQQSPDTNIELPRPQRQRKRHGTLVIPSKQTILVDIGVDDQMAQSSNRAKEVLDQLHQIFCSLFGLIE